MFQTGKSWKNEDRRGLFSGSDLQKVRTIRLPQVFSTGCRHVCSDVLKTKPFENDKPSDGQDLCSAEKPNDEECPGFTLHTNKPTRTFRGESVPQHHTSSTVPDSGHRLFVAANCRLKQPNLVLTVCICVYNKILFFYYYMV